MKARLHTIKWDEENDGKLWCGYAVICSLADVPAGKVRESVARILGPRKMRMSLPEVAAVGQHYRITFRQWALPGFQKPTLAEWMRSRRPEHTFLVGLTDHWLLADRNLVQDSFERAPVAFNRHWCRRRRVEEVFTCEIE
jgi:hypothetical protein